MTAEKDMFDWRVILEQPLSSRELEEWSKRIIDTGYPAVRRMIDYTTARIEQFSDGEMEAVRRMLDRCEQLVPHPQRVSPAWETVWDRLRRVMEAKNSVLGAVPPGQRDGEWQIVMDNPYTTQEVVCYPGLTFDRAAYLYGYFVPELKNNEYIRVQKVTTVIMHFGPSPERRPESS